MVKYGLGLWAVLAWIMLSSLIPLRRLCYEFFVLQHIVSAGVFLWLLSVHVPAHASYNIWMAVAFVLTGRGFRFCVFVCRNAGIQRKRFGLTPGKGVGHTAELQGLAGEITRITIHGVKFSWKAGQHVLLWCPTLGPLESHPFTIANIAAENSSNDTTKVELIIRARSGFTRRLHQRALSSRRTNPVTVTAFVTGPFGNLPTWNAYETLVLISASTGASFTLPILESVLRSTCCVRRIECLLLVREKSHLDGYLSRLLAAASQSIPSGIALRITLAVTGKQASLGFEEDTAIEIGSTLSSSSTNARSDTLSKWPATTAESSLSSFHKVANVPERNHSSRGEEQDIGFASNGQCYKNINKQDGLLNYTLGRPSLADFIREPVEASAGETSVVVCGGKSLTSFVANCVASLSDERAVHKGTGAQGIHLHVEEFGL